MTGTPPLLSTPDPTARQREIYAFILDFRRQHHYSPTAPEIADHFDIHTSAIQRHLKALARKRWLAVDARVSRSIRPLKDADEACPHCGRPMDLNSGGGT